MVPSEMPECLENLLQWNARSRVGSLPDATRGLDIVNSSTRRAPNQVVPLEGKGDARKSGATILEKQEQGEDADRSGRDVRQGGALKTMVNPHVGTHV